jgi:hypothetical protein
VLKLLITNLPFEISPEKEKDLEKTLSPYNNWWRCPDLNRGHYGYEPYALTS